MSRSLLTAKWRGAETAGVIISRICWDSSSAFTSRRNAERVHKGRKRAPMDVRHFLLKVVKAGLPVRIGNSTAAAFIALAKWYALGRIDVA